MAKDWRKLYTTTDVNVLGTHYLETPVDLKYFIESKEFCGHDPLTDIQYYEVYRALGKDPLKIWSPERVVRIMVCLWGKGSGKGTTSALVSLYLFYNLLCMDDCHKFFGRANADPLSFANVALSGDQASRFFERFKERLRKCGWFREFKMVDQGKNIKGTGSERRGNEDIIEMTGSTVKFFPHTQNLTAISLHAQQEKWEDMTLFGWLCDEISGFRSETGIYNGEGILKTLKFSTRELPYLGIITSFPRLDEDNDLCFKEYKEAVKLEKEMGELSPVIGSKYMTWEVLGLGGRFFSGKMIDFNMGKSGIVIQIPVEYQQEARSDPEGFKQRKMCIPGSGIGDFFQYSHYLDNILTRPSIIQTVDEFVEMMDKVRLRKKIVRLIEDKHTPRVICLDAGLSSSEASLAIAHREEVIKEKLKCIMVVVDGLIVWTPNEKEGIIVDVQNYQDVIEIITNYLLIDKVRLDHWNAAAIESNLSSKGIRCDVKNASYDSYSKMRETIYGSGLILPDQIEDSLNNDGEQVQVNRKNQFIIQCKMLKSKKMLKPRVEMGRQDLSDVIAHCCEVLLEGVSFSDENVSIGFAVGSSMTSGRPMHQQAKEEIEQTFGFKKKVSNPKGKSDDSASDLAVII